MLAILMSFLTSYIQQKQVIHNQYLNNKQATKFLGNVNILLLFKGLLYYSFFFLLYFINLLYKKKQYWTEEQCTATLGYN